jgi:tetratricopeptide (TPR) repeat protein
MSASQELEKAATEYAIEAIRLDKQGSRGMAITMYQKAIETLLKLVRLYPNYGLNSVYIQRATAYQERIKVLQGAGPYQVRPEEGPNAASAPSKKRESKL